MGWLDLSNVSNILRQSYINGFLDVSRTLIVRGDASLNGNLFIAGDVSLNGNLRANYPDSTIPPSAIIGGVSTGIFINDISASKRMFVAGDVSLNSKLFVAGDVSFNGNLRANYPDSTIPPSAIIGGVSTGIFINDISASKRVFVNEDVSLNSKLFVGGDVSLNGSVNIGNDITIGGRLNVKNYTNQNIINTTTTNYQLIVSEDLSLNGRLVASGDSSFNGNVYVSGFMTAATQSISDNSTRVATTEYARNLVDTSINNALSNYSTKSVIDTSLTLYYTKTAVDSSVNTLLDTTYSTKSVIDTSFNLKANLANPTFTGTVGGITKSMVGLGSVDNTSDASKPVSTATQTALDLKANLANPTFTGTVGGITKSMVGLGSVDNTSDASKPVSTATQTALDLKANLESPIFTGTVGGITKSMVGLGNVDNTSDASKPVSTATQTALDLKANLANPIFTGSAIIPVGNITTLNVFGDASLNGNIMIGRDLTIRGNLAVQNYTNQNIINTTTTNYQLIVSEDISLNGRLVASGDSSFNGNVYTTGFITAATQSISDNSTRVATTAYTRNLVDTSLNNALSNYSTKSVIDTSLNLKANLESPIFTGTVGGITKSMVGLDSVDNTSDASKPVSTATQTALDLKANLANPTFTGTVGGITKSMVGLDSVDNTSDASKPVSTATQTALDLKANLANPIFTGSVIIPTGNLTTLNVFGDASLNGNLILNGSFHSLNDISVNTLTIGRGGGAIATNTAIGYQSLNTNITGASITAIGYQALTTLKGNYNTGMGYQALNSNGGGGSYCTAVGYQAGYANQNGSNNTSFGSQALFSTTSGQNNISIGVSSLYTNTSGNSNTAIGSSALYSVNASNNTAVGFYALTLTTSSNNTAFGYQAGNTNTSGNNNTFIGFQAQSNANNYSNSTALGAGAIITGSNQVVLGRASEKVVMPGDASLNGNIVIGRNLTVLGNLAIQNYSNQNIINTTTTNYQLIVSEDLSLNGRLVASGDSSFNGNLYVSGFMTTATQSITDNSTRVATTAYVRNLVDTSLNNALSNYSTKSVIDTSLGFYYTKIEIDASVNNLINNINLTNYYTKSVIDTSINTLLTTAYSTKLAIDSSLALYSTKSIIDTSLALYSTKSIIDTSLALYSTKSIIDASLALYSTKSIIDTSLALYSTKSIIDTSLALYSTNSIIDSSLNLKANLASPTFTGTAIIPTGNITTLNVFGDSSLNGNIVIGRNLTVNGNLAVQNYSNQNIINTTTTNYQLIVSEDLSLNGRLCVSNDTSLNGRLFVANDLSLNGNLYVRSIDVKDISGVNNFFGNLQYTYQTPNTATFDANGFAILKNIDSSATVIYSTIDMSINGNLFVGNDISYNGNLYLTPNSVDPMAIRYGISNQFGAFQFNYNTPNTASYDADGFGVLRYIDSSSQVLYSKTDLSLNGKLLVAGNVGIGTVSPSGDLHIYESIGTTISSVNGTIILEHGNDGGTSSILFKSKKNAGSDYGYMYYMDDICGNITLERSALCIGVENDEGNNNGVASVSDVLLLNRGGCYVGIGMTNPTTLLQVNGTTTSTIFNALSDYRLKDNITTLDGTYIIDNLRPVKYTFKSNNSQQLGFIAHEVQEYYPELVEGEKDGENHQSINLNGIIPLLVNDLKRSKERIAELETRMKNIESQLSRMI